MKGKTKVKKHNAKRITAIDVIKSVRKDMPPPSSVHGRHKYRRSNDWKREID